MWLRNNRLTLVRYKENHKHCCTCGHLIQDSIEFIDSRISLIHTNESNLIVTIDDMQLYIIRRGEHSYVGLPLGKEKKISLEQMIRMEREFDSMTGEVGVWRI